MRTLAALFALLAAASARADVAPGPLEPRFSRCDGGLRPGDAPRAQITEAPLGGHWSVAPPIDDVGTQSELAEIVDGAGALSDTERVGGDTESIQIAVPADAAVGDVYIATGLNGFEELELRVVAGVPAAITAEIGEVTLVRFRPQVGCQCTNDISNEGELRVALSGGPALLDIELFRADDDPSSNVFGRLVADGEVIVGLKEDWGGFDSLRTARVILRDPQTLAVLAEAEVELTSDGVPIDNEGLENCGCGCDVTQSNPSWLLSVSAGVLAIWLVRRRARR